MTIREYLEGDHQRLDSLLARASADPENPEMASFNEFRRGLLKHIGMEEKILFPAIQQIRAGVPLEVASRLRVQHGAIAALLVPSPRRAVLHALRTILSIHNGVEEGPQGVYAECDQIAKAEGDEILERLKSAPEVPAAAHVDGPNVEASARRALDRAGFDSRLLDS